MSKSLGNFVTLKEGLERFSPNALRFFYIQSNYRSPLDYDEKVIASMDEGVEKIFNTLRNLEENKKENEVDEEFRKKTDEEAMKFHESMENNFDTASAIAALFNMIRAVNGHLGKEKTDNEELKKVKREIEDILWTLGLEREEVSLDSKKGEIEKVAKELGVEEKTSPEKLIQKLIELRNSSRENKDYETSDRIRNSLKGIGIILEDKKEGGSGWRLE